MANPTITKTQFDKLGYKQTRIRMEDKNNTWSIAYTKRINIDYDFDEINIEWFCGTQRYSIRRNTRSIRNIPLFEGFLNSTKDLIYIEKLFDLTRFYDIKPERQKYGI